VCTLVLVSLVMMTNHLNRIDSGRDRQAIVAAMDSFQRQLAQTVSDEATWTAAYLNTYVVHDLAWLDSTWGNSARTGSSFDTAIVTDANGLILFGENRRGPLGGLISSHFSGSSDILAALHAGASETGAGASAAHFARTGNGVAALAGAVIRSSRGQISAPQEERRILWFSRQLDETVLKEFGSRFQVPIPYLATAAGSDENSLGLVDAAGAEAGWVAWQPQRPGDVALVGAVSAASLVMLVIGVLTFAVLVAFRRSVTRRAEAEERDWINARYDPGTGLLNGFGLEESLIRMLPRRGAMEVAVAYIEFEGLKDVTDAYGQETTERLLDAVADLIDSGIEGRAQCARMSPDTFLLCRTGEDAGALIRQFSRSVIDILGEPVALGDLRLKLGCSIGFALAPCDRDGVAEPIRMGAAALQRARETGGNHIIEYDTSIEEMRQRRLDLQADIRRGLDADEFDVEYQPIIDVSGNRLSGVEALLRWKRRRGGPMSPADFIPAAEASGLIEELGLFALRRACRDIVRYPDLKLSVNVSTVQFRSPRLARQIDRILLANEFPANRLQLEITESFLLAQPERAKAAIEELRGRGIVIALDDFGTGFASIGYLQEFQFDRVKLDRSLVDEIDLDPVKSALVESTMVFAFAMGLAVTAEGVERHEEARALTRLGCREFQGYLFSRPLPLEALDRLLAGESSQMRLAG
jgi:EAL domain-containing protein (putative c-di-GMP-specific phosphodiesterase class I)/GGDEF domain-containing protein